MGHQRKVRYVYFVEFDVLPIEHQNTDSGEALIVASWPKAKPLYAQDRQETAGGKIEDAKLKRVIEWQWLTMSEMPPGMREKAGENCLSKRFSRLCGRKFERGVPSGRFAYLRL